MSVETPAGKEGHAMRVRVEWDHPYRNERMTEETRVTMPHPYRSRQLAIELARCRLDIHPDDFVRGKVIDS